MNKPFSTAELLARLRAARRRAQPVADNAVFHSGPLQVDLSSRMVTVKGKEVKMTPTEYSLLRLLVRNAGKVVTHRQILERVNYYWGPEVYGELPRRIICAFIWRTCGKNWTPGVWETGPTSPRAA
jgi:two-component system, OmpR family, KDP operon response regulator KdpE